MKTTKLLILLFFLSQITYADIVPSNSHLVKKCVRIINSNDFPNLYIIGFVTGPTITKKETFIVNSKNCLEKGYKFNQLQVFAVRKNYLDNKNIETIDILNDTNFLKSNIDIDCGDTYIENNNPIKSIDIFYKIIAFTKSTFILYKYQELTKYNNGAPNSLKSFSYIGKDGFLNKKSLPNDNIKTDYNIKEIYPDTEIFNFLKALLITLFSETIVLFVIFRTKYKQLNINRNSLLFTGIIASITTLPYVWFIIPIFIKSTFLYLIISETSVTILESIIIYKLLQINYKKALMASILCNLTSFLIGLALNKLNCL